MKYSDRKKSQDYLDAQERKAGVYKFLWFEKLGFCDGLVWTVSPIVSNEFLRHSMDAA